MNEVTFTAALLDFESGISPYQTGYYDTHWHEPVVPYWMVEKPGRCIRDAEGGLIPVCLTVSQYFYSVGLLECAPPLSYVDLANLQCSTINPLGFVGFQFGERLLWQLGCYEPEQVLAEDTNTYVPRLYIGNMDDHVWKNGNREYLHSDPKLGYVLASDTNEWRGEFTGRFSIHDFECLKDRAIQLKLFYESVRYSFEILIANADRYLDERVVEVILGKKHRLSVFENVTITQSGLAAACHLVGPTAVAEYLSVGRAAVDEINTGVRDYLVRFGRTRFDVVLPTKM